KMLDSAVQTKLSEPVTDGERQYVEFSSLARKHQERFDDLAAAAVWETMAGTIKEDDPNERRWHLLARKRAEDLRKGVAARRAIVAGQLRRIEEAWQAGRYN